MLRNEPVEEKQINYIDVCPTVGYLLLTNANLPPGSLFTFHSSHLTKNPFSTNHRGQRFDLPQLVGPGVDFPGILTREERDDGGDEAEAERVRAALADELRRWREAMEQEIEQQRNQGEAWVNT